ncbi:hypothetical protein SNOG_02505 [Parastagonospora nodorum SN15]|uniref:Uncharacterized protein n=1 Tax=Phaeosphaeria nodorum (strain SN15 / ATCC MYA-4574 / FGSC 10173) TaxID=321614 RepID=Q0V0F9_PHANO|nr:hypothetical protein SNOG_02505 [Parastagonospora nodorum SN15]EAT90717.1 hypothetical protein SNOG_02505 [Parastagonospora nodorum SN15]
MACTRRPNGSNMTPFDLDLGSRYSSASRDTGENNKYRSRPTSTAQEMIARPSMLNPGDWLPVLYLHEALGKRAI